MRAKLRAQIDTGAILSARTRAPAATSRPAMVSISGRPAATRLPNATARMVRVTGHDSSSERIMAERLALLKFAHRALSPVRVTVMPDVPSLATGPARDSAAVDHRVGAGRRAGGDDPGPPVPGQRDAVLRCDDGGDPPVGSQHRRHVAEDPPGGGVGGEGGVMVDDDGLEGTGTQAGEVPLDQVAGRDGLAGGVLPASPRQRRQDAGREHPEDDQHRPVRGSKW